MEKSTKKYCYTAEFKIEVVETMLHEQLSYNEVSKRYNINGHDTVKKWEKIYLEKGIKGFEDEPKKKETYTPGKQYQTENIPKEFLAELYRLRAENAFLKKLNALVAENERHKTSQK